MINLFTKQAKFSKSLNVSYHSNYLNKNLYNAYNAPIVSKISTLHQLASYNFSLERKKQNEKLNKQMKEAIEQRDIDNQKNYKKRGDLYPEANREYSSLSEQPITETPSDLWKSLLILQLPQVYYLYQASTSEYFSFAFSNSLSLLMDSACLTMGMLGGMYFGYAILKRESYHILLTPLTIGCLVASMHMAYNLNTLCFLPIYLAQLIQLLADYQGCESRRYPNFILSMKSRFFMINFMITLLGFFIMQGFLNYKTNMNTLKSSYENQSREIAEKQKSTQNS